MIYWFYTLGQREKMYFFIALQFTLCLSRQIASAELLFWGEAELGY